MVMHVKAKASELKFATWREADDCLEQGNHYDVECENLKRNLGLLNNTYELRIEGSESNIKSFLSFLKMKGFKMKVF